MIDPGSEQARPQIPIEDFSTSRFDSLYRFPGIVGIGRFEQCHTVEIIRNAIVYRVEATLSAPSFGRISLSNIDRWSL